MHLSAHVTGESIIERRYELRNIGALDGTRAHEMFGSAYMTHKVKPALEAHVACAHAAGKWNLGEKTARKTRIDLVGQIVVSVAHTHTRQAKYSPHFAAGLLAQFKQTTHGDAQH